MKNLITFLCLTIYISVKVFTQDWTVVLRPDMTSELNDVFFVNAIKGWVVGNNGSIFYTTDGGMNWVEQNSGTDLNLSKVYFINEDVGWVGTQNGSVLKTTNGGISWTELVFNRGLNYFDGIYFTSLNEGHILSGKSTVNYILRTTDGGISWLRRDSIVTSALRWYDISFYDQNIGAVVGNNKDLQRYTTDGGNIWEKSVPIVDNLFRDLRAVRWLSPANVVALGEGNEFWGIPTPFYKSTDGGVNWVKKTQTPAINSDRNKDAYFKNSLEGIGVGSNGFSWAYISKTTDGGESWLASNANYSFGLKAIAGIENTLYVLGVGCHIIKSTDFGNTWSIFPILTPNSIYGIQFVEGKGFAVNRYSDVLISEDGSGSIWKYSASAGIWDAFSMHFLDSSTGFILKENRHIVKTSDGGRTWITVLESVPFSSRNKVGGITFGGPTTGYAWMSLNDYGEYYVFKTTDRGNNWNQIYSTGGPGYISGDIVFFDENIGCIAGPKRWLMRTTNGGVSWDSASFQNFPASLPVKDFEDVCVVDENRAWAVGEKFICFTSNKGATWSYVHHNIIDIDSTFYTVAFYRDTLGYIGCYDGTIIRTSDGGNTWSKHTIFKDVYHFYSSAFNENGKIFLGTSNGVIVALEQPSSVNDNDLNNTLLNYDLINNYPNPFNSSTTLRFYLPKAGNVKITLYDILGRQITTLINMHYEAGYHEVFFNVNSIELELSSGIYYYQFNSERFTATRKLLLMK